VTRTIVAIDGPAGAGKSTAARLVAQRLGLAHIDTGATYRLVALQALRENTPLDDPDALADVARRVAQRTELGPQGELRFDDAPVGGEIRTPEVTAAASVVAAHPEVRTVLVQMQRALVPGAGAVVEGRDIGTVVWPDADVKVYLDAQPEVRAARRVEATPSAVSERDARDATRPVGAMRAADDAAIIDTTELLPEAVAEAIVTRLRPAPVDRAPDAPPAAERVKAPPAAHPSNSRLLYWLMNGVLAVALRLVFRLQVRGREKIPRSGPVILAPNHRSLIDIPLAGAVSTRRQIRFMAKDELFATKLSAWLMWRLGAFPIRRGKPDRASLNTALRLLREGGLVGVFPEGTRTPSARFDELEEGLAYLALKSGATIVPVAISGTEAAFPPGKRFIRFVKMRALVGEPFTLGGPIEGVLPRSRVREATVEAQRRLRAVMDELEPR
jgi:CMP/dCMP kinase